MVGLDTCFKVQFHIIHGLDDAQSNPQQKPPTRSNTHENIMKKILRVQTFSSKLGWWSTKFPFYEGRYCWVSTKIL